MWLGIARCLRSLAPRQAPGNLVSNANVRMPGDMMRTPYRALAGMPCLADRVRAHATVDRVSGRTRRLYNFELEPEVRDWLGSLSDSDFKRVDEVCGLLAEKGTELGGPAKGRCDGRLPHPLGTPARGSRRSR